MIIKYSHLFVFSYLYKYYWIFICTAPISYFTLVSMVIYWYRFLKNIYIYILYMYVYLYTVYTFIYLSKYLYNLILTISRPEWGIQWVSSNRYSPPPLPYCPPPFLHIPPPLSPIFPLSSPGRVLIRLTSAWRGGEVLGETSEAGNLSLATL